MSRRYDLGVLVERVADWLKYGRTPASCAVPGCGFYETSGVHAPGDDCAKCLGSPVKHHAFVHPRRAGRLLRRLNFVRS